MPGSFVLFSTELHDFTNKKGRRLNADFFVLDKVIRSFPINGCFATNKTLARWLNVPERRVGEGVRYLSGLGNISTFKKNYLTVKKHNIYLSYNDRSCVPIFNDFLRNPFIKPMTKLVAILLWKYKRTRRPAVTAIRLLGISRRTFQTHISTLRKYSILSREDYTFLQELGPAGRPAWTALPEEHSGEEKRIPDVKENARIINAFNNNKINNTDTYTNLLGETVAQPENTDPVVILNMHHEEEKRLRERLEKEQLEYIKQNCPSLLENGNENMISELKKLIPKAGIKARIQAAYETGEKARRTQVRNRLSYAFGILRQHTRVFPDKPELLTVRPYEEILRLETAKSSGRKRVQTEGIKLRQVEELEARNREYVNSLLEGAKQDIVRGYRMRVDPNGKFLKSFDDERILEMAACDENFMVPIMR